MYKDTTGKLVYEAKDFQIGEKVKWDKENDFRIVGMKNTPLHICQAKCLTIRKIGRTRVGVSHRKKGKIYMVDPYILKKLEEGG
jgi:hypothetical protein